LASDAQVKFYTGIEAAAGIRKLGGNMATAPPARLNIEIETYESQKASWLREHRDEFVVIKGANVLGFFPEFHVAYTAGVNKYGAKTDFLVKRVALQEPVFVIF
jgi:hypothetical protein